MSNFKKVCFFSEPEDTKFFGSSVAINEQYLIVGDPGANRVIVYQNNSTGQWQRSFDICPPENSSIFRAGRGFGKSLALNENVLMVSSVVKIRSSSLYLASSDNFRNFLDKDIENSQTLFQKYIFDLDSRHQIAQIDCIPNRQKELTNFYILHNGEFKLITLPNNNEEMFGTSIAIPGLFHSKWYCNYGSLIKPEE